MPKTCIAKSFSFEAAHSLPQHEGKCKNVHGHSYRLEVTVCGPVQKSGPEEGMVMDFGKLSDLVKREIIEMWDHTYLNDVVSFTPTAENLANEILRRLQEKGLSVQRIELWETKKSRAIVEPSM